MNGLSDLAEAILSMRAGMRDSVKRGIAQIVNSYPDGTCDVYLNGNTSTLVQGISYSGSAYVPNPGEFWAVDSHQGDHIVTFRLASGPGTQPAAYVAPPSPPPGFDALFSLPGTLPASTGLSGSYPLTVDTGAATLTVTATVGTTDASNTVEVGVYQNGTRITTVTIGKGLSVAQELLSVSNLGQDGDLIQVELVAYAGSVAADLVVRVTGT